MAVQNVMIKTDLVENFPVCCTANLSIEVSELKAVQSHQHSITSKTCIDPKYSQAINDFFAQVHQQEQEENATPCLTLVDNLETRLWGPTEKVQGDDGTLQSPFAGSDFLRVGQLLRQMKKITHSALDTEWFLILDEQSEKSSSAVVINVEDDEVTSVRVDYPVSSRYISAASVCSPSLDELIEIAEGQDDGILRD